MGFRIFKKILMLDDSKEDLKCFTEALKENQLIHKIKVFDRHVDFESYARSCENFSWRTPDLIIMDLNMPQKNGIDVVKELRRSSVFKAVPIIMMSSSELTHEMFESYDAGINFFIKKPDDFTDWIKVVKTLDKVWLEN